MKKLIIAFALLPLSAVASDTTSIKGSVSLQGNYTSGNYNMYSIGGRAEFKYIRNKSSFELAPSCKYTEIGYIKSVATANKDSFSLEEKEFYNVISYSYSINKIKLISFSEQEYSFLRKINLRCDLGVGVGYKIFKSKTTQLELSEAILPEMVYRENDDITSVRYSTRLKLSYDKKPIRFSNVLLYQPSLYNTKGVDNSSNLNIRNTTTFDVSVIKNLSVGLCNDYILQSYVHYLFPNKRKYDNSLTFYIKYYL